MKEAEAVEAVEAEEAVDQVVQTYLQVEGSRSSRSSRSRRSSRSSGSNVHVPAKKDGGAYQIPNNMLQNLMNMNHLLNQKQLSDVMNAINMGLDVIIKSTKAQTGRGIGTILASIGIPMLIDAIRGKGLQVDAVKDGGLVLPHRSPPFFGSWDQKNYPIGMGVKKKVKV